MVAQEEMEAWVQSEWRSNRDVKGWDRLVDKLYAYLDGLRVARNVLYSRVRSASESEQGALLDAAAELLSVSEDVLFLANQALARCLAELAL